MNTQESGLDKTLAFLASEEFDKLIAATKEFWDECDYMGNPGAPDDVINTLKERYAEFYRAPAPEGYIAFMCKLDGFTYKDFDIYSCKEVMDEHWDGFYFIFGTEKKTFCAYDYGSGKYVTLKSEPTRLLSDTDSEGNSSYIEEAIYTPCETYDSFADMFKTIMMFTLPADKLNKVYPKLKGWDS